MATLDDIGQQKQRISERLARLDAERTKLGDQFDELEITERVLAQFGDRAATTGRQGRGRPARTAPALGWAAKGPRWPASTHGINERRRFEGRAGTWRWRDRERSS